MSPELKTEGNNISEQSHQKRWPLRLTGRYLRPVLTALLFAQTLALPASSLAEDKTTGNQISSDYLVDIMIHRSLPPHETEEWAKDTINNYINQRFDQAGINKKLRVDRVITNYDEREGCPLGGVKEKNICAYDDYSRIRVWLYKNGEAGDAPATSANPESAQIYMNVPVQRAISDSLWEMENDRRSLAHETGHLFKMPDYYYEYVSSRYNYVAPVGVRPYAQDIMGEIANYDHFSPTSKGFADRTFELPSGFGTPLWNIQYTPRNTILRLVDNDGLPMQNVSIEVFPQKWEYIDSPHQIISPIATLTGVTDEDGEFVLGNHAKIFDNPGSCSCGSAFLRITNGDTVKYTAMTRSYLNNLYFQGFEDNALVSVPFSALHTLGEGRNRYLTAPGIFVEF